MRARLVGASRSYIEETLRHIGSLMADEETLIDKSEVLVVGLRTMRCSPRRGRVAAPTTSS